MEVSTVFFSCVGMTAVGMILVFINIFLFSRKALDFDTHLNIKKTFSIHILAGFLYMMGFFGVIISGIIWLVQHLKL